MRESIPIRNNVQVASPADFESLTREKDTTEIMEYGFQNEAMRKDLQSRKNQAHHKMPSVLVSGDDLGKYYTAYPGELQANQTLLDLGIPNTDKVGSVCDGDSGAGFFV